MYSKDFVDAVRRCYPNSENIIAAAENGDYFLGRYLDDSAFGAVDAEFILTHTAEEVYQKAMVEKERRELYRRWSRGECYDNSGERQVYCPANWLQNNNNSRRYELTDQICKGAKYTGYYPDCERYGCKHLCWEKYDTLTKGLSKNDT